LSNKIIGTVRAIPLAEKTQSILKINGNYSFFAIPTSVLEKYGIDSFVIVQNEDKILLKATNATEPTTENPTSTKMEITDDKFTG